MKKYLLLLILGLLLSCVMHKALANDQNADDADEENDSSEDDGEPEETIPVGLGDIIDENLKKEQGFEMYDSDGNIINNSTQNTEEIRGSLSRETDESGNSTANSVEDDEYSAEKWNEVMQDFTPDDILTFDVEAWGQEILFEEVDTESVIRGAYFVSSEEDEQIDFTIYNPDQSVLFSRVAKRDGLFRLRLQNKGNYSIQFSNEKFLKSKTVTFAFHATHKIKQGHAKRDHIAELDMSLRRTHKTINVLMFRSRFTEKRQESHYQTILSTHSKLLGFTLFETLAILATTIIQIYYIEQLLQNKIVV